MVTVLREKFSHFDLTFSIGGQISFDVSACDYFAYALWKFIIKILSQVI